MTTIDNDNCGEIDDGCDGNEIKNKQRVEAPEQRKPDTALIWLLLGGIFGWHHLYMKRTNQAIVYACSLGFCGIGVLYDMFTIDFYCSESNIDEDFADRFEKRRQPTSNFIPIGRSSIEIMFGLLSGYVCLYSVPNDWLDHDKVKSCNQLKPVLN